MSPMLKSPASKTGKGLSVRELGRRMGISGPAVCKLKAKGMPTASVAEAMDWRHRNTRTFATLQRFQQTCEIKDNAATRKQRELDDIAAMSADDLRRLDVQIPTVDHAAAFFRVILDNYDAQLWAMPDDLCARANPDNPTVARAALAQWVADFLARVRPGGQGPRTRTRTRRSLPPRKK